MGELSLTQYRQEIRDILSSTSLPEERYNALLIFYSINRFKLPLFPDKQFTKRIWGHKPFMFEYEGKYYLSGKSILMQDEFYIEPEWCVGDKWLYNNSRKDGRPLPDRMAEITLGTPEIIPFISVDKINNNLYYTTDGCHRIYMAYLLGRSIKVQIHSELLCSEEFVADRF